MKKLSVLLLLVVVIGSSGCSLFRKKNKCNTCPVWKDNIELNQDLSTVPVE